MATLNDAIIQTQAIIRKLAGVRAAPDYPPEKMAIFPFVVAFAGPGNWEWGAGGQIKKGLHTIKIELHIARKDLPRAIKAAMPFADSVPNALMADHTLGGTVSTYSNIRTDGIIPLSWNGIDTIGFRWYIEGIKIETIIE